MIRAAVAGEIVGRGWWMKLVGLAGGGGGTGCVGMEGDDLHLAAEQPVAEATPPPGREVLMVDVASAEAAGEDVPNFRLAVEPGQKFRSFDAVDHTIVQFVANFFGETRDFSGSGGEHISYLHRLETVGFRPVSVGIRCAEVITEWVMVSLHRLEWVWFHDNQLCGEEPVRASPRPRRYQDRHSVKTSRIREGHIRQMSSSVVSEAFFVAGWNSDGKFLRSQAV